MKGRRKSIGLIGFMGSGKTTVGKALAGKINWNFVDTDSIIEERAGKPIHRIFSENSEKWFRELETEVVGEVCELESTVISFGGGVLLNPSNTKMITENTIVVLLSVSIDTVVARTSSNHTRPLLKMEGNLRRERIISLFYQREEQYWSVADIVLDTDNLSVDKIVVEISRRMKL
jgi:shikimate kinase